MARTNATNFSGGLQFPYATAGTDLFKKEDVQTLALAVDQHDHSTGKGLILAASAMPPITSAMIQDGTIQGGDIASGAVGYTNLAVGAATNLLGVYQAIPSFSTSSTGSWVATPITVTGTALGIVGSYVLAWATLQAGHSGAVGAAAFVSILADGVPISGSLAVIQVATTGIGQALAMHVWHQPTAGSHTWAVGINNNSAGTITLNGSVVASLVVLEVRR